MADLIVILIMIACTFFGFKKGLIKVGVRIISFIFAIVIALILYTPISNYIIENTQVVPNLKNVIYSKLYDEGDKIEETEIDTNFAEMVSNYITKYKNEAQANTSEFISEQIAIMIVRIGTWIGLFMISRVILLFIRFFADRIAEIPIIKQFNKARRNDIWSTRRICNNICITCSFEYGFSNDRR